MLGFGVEGKGQGGEGNERGHAIPDGARSGNVDMLQLPSTACLPACSNSHSLEHTQLINKYS